MYFAPDNNNMIGAPSRAEQKEWRNQHDTQAILAAGRQALLDVEQGMHHDELPLPNWRDSVSEDKMNVNNFIRDMNQLNHHHQQQQLPQSRQRNNKNQSQQHQQQQRNEKMRELEKEVIVSKFNPN